MLFDLPRKPASSDVAPIENASDDSRTATEGITSMFDARRAALDFRRGIPDRSKHCVSPSALSAALLKFTDVRSSDTDDDESGTDDALRNYKRARIDETSARLRGGPLLPEAGPSSESRIKEEKSASVQQDENSYWESAFGQAETNPTKVATEGTSQSARRLLFEYGRRNARPTPVLQLSKCDADASSSATLPHRHRNPNPAPDASNAAGNVSEDEGFAMVHHSHAIGNSTPHTHMSSPELVPAASIAQATTDDEATSDDEWTKL
jgi:hypothetical protein